ncbi:MAG: accessory factor UbiK family protein [Zetaproteobacteria bacterium]|nr:MAG: accessory factor UbiK family protein [Zetaproteobacteria bacterium]
MAIANETIDQIAGNIASGLKMLGELKQGAEIQIRSIVESALSQFDIVTEEQMKVQEALLQKTREQMDALEQRIVALEHKLRERQE